MANEELIYRITRAVYDRVGSAVDENTVEQLVTDIYREVKDAVSNGTGQMTPSLQTTDVAGVSAEGSSSRMVISVFGLDHPGIVAGVSQILAEAPAPGTAVGGINSCSIIDINQTVVQGKFAMVIVVDTTRARESAAELKDRLRREGEKLGVRIYAQREDLFNAMHRI